MEDHHGQRTVPPNHARRRREAERGARAAFATRDTVRALPIAAPATADPDHERLTSWADTLRAERTHRPQASPSAAPPSASASSRAARRTRRTPSRPISAPVATRRTVEPLTLWLTRFDCVSLVESCLAVARAARASRGTPTWDAFAREIERMRYRGGMRGSYASRLHYFSEWISDGARRGLLRDIGPSLGAEDDTRPLRFMTEHRKSYVGLADDRVFDQIATMERSLDGQPRHVIPTAHIAEVVRPHPDRRRPRLRHVDPRPRRHALRVRLPRSRAACCACCMRRSRAARRGEPLRAPRLRRRDQALDGNSPRAPPVDRQAESTAPWCFTRRRGRHEALRDALAGSRGDAEHARLHDDWPRMVRRRDLSAGPQSIWGRGGEERCAGARLDPESSSPRLRALHVRAPRAPRETPRRSTRTLRSLGTTESVPIAVQSQRSSQHSPQLQHSLRIPVRELVQHRHRQRQPLHRAMPPARTAERHRVPARVVPPLLVERRVQPRAARRALAEVRPPHHAVLIP